MGATAAGKLEKKKEEQDFRKIINDVISQALASKGGFRPEVVQQYEVVGLESRKERESQKRLVSVPSRPLEKIVVSKNEGVKKEISPHMTEKAIEGAVLLGEIIEKAAEQDNKKKLTFGQWVKS